MGILRKVANALSKKRNGEKHPIYMADPNRHKILYIDKPASTPPPSGKRIEEIRNKFADIWGKSDS